MTVIGTGTCGRHGGPRGREVGASACVGHDTSSSN